jgi:hypothetical protein
MTLLVKSQICRKQLGHAIFETQKDRDLAPVKRALATVEILLPRLNQQSLLWRGLARVGLQALGALIGFRGLRVPCAPKTVACF